MTTLYSEEITLNASNNYVLNKKASESKNLHPGRSLSEQYLTLMK